MLKILNTKIDVYCASEQISKEECAKRFNIALGTLNNWTGGETKPILTQELVNFMKALKIKAQDFFN